MQAIPNCRTPWKKLASIGRQRKEWSNDSQTSAKPFLCESLSNLSVWYLLTNSWRYRFRRNGETAHSSYARKSSQWWCSCALKSSLRSRQRLREPTWRTIKRKCCMSPFRATSESGSSKVSSTSQSPTLWRSWTKNSDHNSLSGLQKEGLNN